MLEIPTLGPLVTILLLLSISGVVSWGITQLVRYIILWLNRDHADTSWYNIVLRIVALIIGGAQGFILIHSILGLSLGVGAGVLNTTIVALVKSKLKGLKLSNEANSQEVDPNDPTQ